MGDTCETLGRGLVRFCHECGDFPCQRLKSLDHRYRSKYHLSMIENLRAIEAHGMPAFLEEEAEKMEMPRLRRRDLLPQRLCLSCHIDTLRSNRKYRWEER